MRSAGAWLGSFSRAAGVAGGAELVWVIRKHSLSRGVISGFGISRVSRHILLTGSALLDTVQPETSHIICRSRGSRRRHNRESLTGPGLMGMAAGTGHCGAVAGP